MFAGGKGVGERVEAGRLLAVLVLGLCLPQHLGALAAAAMRNQPRPLALGQGTRSTTHP